MLDFWSRPETEGLIHHSDRGVQYPCRCGELIRNEWPNTEVESSVGSIEDSYDSRDCRICHRVIQELRGHSNSQVEPNKNLTISSTRHFKMDNPGYNEIQSFSNTIG